MKISLRYFLAIIAILLSILFGFQNMDKNKRLSTVQQQAQIIINGDYFSSLPSSFQKGIKEIQAASSDTVAVRIRR